MVCAKEPSTISVGPADSIRIPVKVSENEDFFLNDGIRCEVVHLLRFENDINSFYL